MSSTAQGWLVLALAAWMARGAAQAESYAALAAWLAVSLALAGYAWHLARRP